MRSRGWSSYDGVSALVRRGRNTRACSLHHVRTQQESDCRQPRKRDLIEPNPEDTLTLGFLSTELWEINFCIWATSSMVFCYGSQDNIKQLYSTVSEVQLGCFLRLSSMKNDYVHLTRSQHFPYRGKTKLKLLFRIPLKKENSPKRTLYNWELCFGKESDIDSHYPLRVLFPTIWSYLLYHSGSHQQIRLNCGRFNNTLFIYLCAVPWNFYHSYAD